MQEQLSIFLYANTLSQGWDQEDCDFLNWYYLQTTNCTDSMEGIIDLCEDTGTSNIPRITINNNLENLIAGVKLKDEIELLKGYLLKEEKLGYGFITWLQKLFLETCYAKSFSSRKSNHIIEPIPYHYVFLNEAVPVVAWTCEQKVLMQSQIFLLFLHKLGLELPKDSSQGFARIPSSWGPKMLYAKAEKLGPIPKDWTKFSLLIDNLHENINQH